MPRKNTSSADGIVYLVGAGPGDAALITVRGARLLERTDVVVYDHLASEKLLSYCPRAETVFAGKQSSSHTLTQEQINDLLIDRARRGLSVVRLKGGDPYVFGRGGEEAQALRLAGVRFEVVPGVTAAVAAACYAGIPLTHRDFNSSFTLITGHEKEDEAGHGSSDLDWSAIARLPCLAFYMAVKSLPRICARLIEHGMSAATPAAIIEWGTTPRQRTVVAPLADLATRAAEAKIGPPAITIVGGVVALRETLNWFESRPLFGRTVLVTRTRQQASELSERLEELGADVIEAPTIELSPQPSPQPSPRVLGEGEKRTPSPSTLGEGRGEGSSFESVVARPFDWIIFTSANGVTFTRQRLLELGLDARAFGAAKIATIGDATARAVERELCLRVDLCPQTFIAEALADEMQKRGEIDGKRHLLLRADIARPVLRQRLEAGGSRQVRDVAIYQTRQAGALPAVVLERLRAGKINWITFTSSSTATNFFRLLGEDGRELLKGVKLASIGPITSQTLRELGLSPQVEARSFNIDGLIEGILSAAADQRSGAR